MQRSSQTANTPRAVAQFLQRDEQVPYAQKRKSLPENSDVFKKHRPSGIDDGQNANVHDANGPPRGQGAAEPKATAKQPAKPQVKLKINVNSIFREVELSERPFH